MSAAKQKSRNLDSHTKLEQIDQKKLDKELSDQVESISSRESANIKPKALDQSKGDVLKSQTSAKLFDKKASLMRISGE